jgi:selenium-binding protein 1
VTRVDADPEGGISLDTEFFIEFAQRAHQIHLQGGDASSDSYCFP